MDDAEFDALLRLAERYVDERPEVLTRLAQAHAAGHPLLRRLVQALRQAEGGGTSHREALRRRFGLTRQEARVAAHLAQGGSVASCAEDLGVAVSTVRSHLKAVFAKTHVSRQSQLAALLRRSREDG